MFINIGLFKQASGEVWRSEKWCQHHCWVRLGIEQDEDVLDRILCNAAFRGSVPPKRLKWWVPFRVDKDVKTVKRCFWVIRGRGS